jgi:two-component system OmpR family response regulator
VPDDPHALTRARLLWADDRRADSLALLKERVRADPTDGAARLALAELYRELIAPDQAGRWGVGVPGWTTEVERDRLARMIAHSGIADHEIPAFLALPAEADLHAEVVALMPAIEMHRAEFADPARMTKRERKAARYASTPSSFAYEVADVAADLAWWVIGIVFALGALLVWVAALCGQPVTALARWTGTATLATTAFVCLARAYTMRTEELVRRKREPDTAPVDVDVLPWISGAILLGLVVAALVSEGVRSGDPFPFSSGRRSPRMAASWPVHRNIRMMDPVTTATPSGFQPAAAPQPRLTRADGSPIRVLVVDDEASLTDLLQMALRYEGWQIRTAENGHQALAAAREFKPDAVVLDIMLPDLDGLQVLSRLRADAEDIPVLFLTAKDSLDDRLAGLTAGGDDYVTKPFSLEEVVARLRGLIRRSTLVVSDEVARAGDPIELTATEFELLRYLMRNPRRVLSKLQILDRVWSYDFGGKSSVVEIYISYLRRKIDAGRNPMIHTVRGSGYMLKAAE